MRRLTENDKRLGPLVFGRTNWNPWRVVFSTGDDDEDQGNSLTIYAFGWVIQMVLPKIMQPHRIKHMAQTWDAATVARMGRNWYYETFPREYGFCLSDGFLQLFLGRQTHDSVTTQSWCCHLPWTQWRFHRFSLYDLEGALFWDQYEIYEGIEKFMVQREWQEKVPSITFEIQDYDGKRILAKTHIQQREYKFGEGRFKWLSLFRPTKICRSLDIAFDAEVGPEKGSWKGGTVGSGIDMLPGELHEQAFRRYCEESHRSKYRDYKITFVGRA
jgi:hypothetical protein